MLKMDQRKILDGGEKLDEDSLLFDFSLIQKLRTVLGLSSKRRTVSSFVHTKEEGNSPNPHIPKRYFRPSFYLISHDEKLFSISAQNYGFFMVVAQTK